MTATLQHLEDELRAYSTRLDRAKRSQRCYERSLMRLDLEHADQALAAEEAALLQAPSCRCGPKAFGDRSEGRCWRCGHQIDRDRKASLCAVYDDATGANREGER